MANAILIDRETGDIDIHGGSAVLGDNTLQCVEQITLSTRGEYKEFPLIGGELPRMFHGNVLRFWPNRLKNMCRAMGHDVRNVEVRDGKLKITI